MLPFGSIMDHKKTQVVNLCHLFDGKKTCNGKSIRLVPFDALVAFLTTDLGQKYRSITLSLLSRHYRQGHQSRYQKYSIPAGTSLQVSKYQDSSVVKLSLATSHTLGKVTRHMLGSRTRLGLFLGQPTITLAAGQHHWWTA